MPSAKSSSAKHIPRPAKAKAHAPAGPAAPDQDALDALDFAQRGRPDAEIGYSEDAPRLTQKQLAEFKAASIRFTGRK